MQDNLQDFVQNKTNGTPTDEAVPGQNKTTASYPELPNKVAHSCRMILLHSFWLSISNSVKFSDLYKWTVLYHSDWNFLV